MKKYISIFLLICTSFSLWAASFQIRSLDVQAQLQKDASLQVQETIEYDIDEINGILFDLDAKGNGPLTKVEVYATDVEGQYQKIPKEEIEISETDELYRFKIYAYTRNQIRKFLIRYTLVGGATLYQDVGEINRVFVGRNWQSPIGFVQVHVSLPDDTPEDFIRSFGHGPLTGNIEREGHTIHYTLENYYPGDFVEAHILFDPSSFQLSSVPASQIRQELAKDRLLEAEKQMAEEANAKREYYQALQKQGNFFFGLEIAALISLLGIAKFFLRKAPALKQEIPEYLRELPDENPPAIVGRLFEKNTSECIFPTLMDFVRRKHLDLEIRGKDSYLKRSSNTPKDSLRPYEKELLEIYIANLGNGNEINLSALSKQKIGTGISARILAWGKKIDQEYRAQHFGKVKSIWNFPIALLAIGLLFATMVALGHFEDFKFVLFFPIIFILVLPYILKSQFPNEKTQESILKWKAFQKFLKDYSLLEEANITSVHIWEHYFVYALILGVADKVVKAYETAVSRGQITEEYNSLHYAPCLYTYRHQPRLSRAVESTYQRSASLIARSQRSSSSGFGGGGFSSGSSGGGGGRGGGGAF